MVRHGPLVHRRVQQRDHPAQMRRRNGVSLDYGAITYYNPGASSILGGDNILSWKVSEMNGRLHGSI